MDNIELDPQVIKVLAERFKISSELAKNLYICYLLSGSCDEGIAGTYSSLQDNPDPKISLKLVMDIFYALDDLYRIVAEDDEKLRKWWKTGEM